MLHLDHESDLFVENAEIYLKVSVLFDHFVSVCQKAYESTGVSPGFDPKHTS